MPERPSVPTELMPGSRMSRWNGKVIDRTGECDSCKCRIVVQEDGELSNVCAWGESWSYLAEPKNSRKTCAKLKEERPKFNVQKFVEEKMRRNQF